MTAAANGCETMTRPEPAACTLPELSPDRATFELAANHAAINSMTPPPSAATRTLSIRNAIVSLTPSAAEAHGRAFDNCTYSRSNIIDTHSMRS